MSKIGFIIKTAGGVIATSITLLSALRENPQLASGIDDAVSKLKQAANTENPKLRFDAKLNAIGVAADAVEEIFPESNEPAGWRRQASALRVRGELAWNANSGATRRRAMKALNAETAEILAQVNRRLTELQAPPEITEEPVL